MYNKVDLRNTTFTSNNYMVNTSDSDNTEKLKKHAILELLEYSPDAAVTKTIIKKITGDITAFCIGEGKELAEKFVPFDTYIQVIDGTASFMINKISYQIKQGEAIIIPAHIKYHVNSGRQFKMIVTVIKSGYEE